MRVLLRSAVERVLREEKKSWTEERRSSKRGTPYYEACRAAEVALNLGLRRVKEMPDAMAE